MWERMYLVAAVAFVFAIFEAAFDALAVPCDADDTVDCYELEQMEAGSGSRSRICLDVVAVQEV